MEQKIIFAGFGGQGVLLAGQLLAQAAMIEDKSVTWLPSYGAAMRGGSANCSVVISDDQVACPAVSEIDVAVIMNKLSLEVFQKDIKPGGTLIYNASLIDKPPLRSDITVIPVKCNEIASDLGNAKVANIVALGAYINFSNIVSKESVLQALRLKMGETKVHLIPVNSEALDRGANAIGRTS